jgi:ATP-dependent DNA helicase RecG
MITELPPGRQKVVTSRILGDGARQKMFDFVRQKLGSGRQAYIVCPRITGDTDGESAEDLSGAEQIHRQLAANELRGFRVGLLHGQLETDTKTRVMEQFRRGELQVLVATTVVEVGVDVPNATLMVIYCAESFGLSQLHQLRGRIRRGRFQGYCFLLTQTENADALSRLQVLEAQADGFAVAEADFQIRGPGDVLGTRQHGNLPLKVADLLRDADVLEEARQVAFDLVRTGEFDRPEYAPLKSQVLERFGQLFALAGSG